MSSYLRLCLVLAVVISSGAPGITGAPGNSDYEFRPKIEYRIVGGKDTPIEQRPFQISLQYFWRHICGGAVISEQWVVTAGHCIYMMKNGPSWSKGIKSGTSWNWPFGWNGRRHSISEILLHPKASIKSVDFDVGIIQIRDKFQLGPAVRSIPIPIEGEASLRYNESAVVSGWGRLKEGAWFFSRYLQSVQVPLVPRQKCHNIYNSSTPYKVTERMLCAAGIGKGSPCQGDSGSPLTQNGHLIGLVSWGMRCNDDTYPSVFVNLLDFQIRSWIKTKTGS